MTYIKGKIYFKNPSQKSCIGFQDAGTCLDCLKKDTSKISCKKLGEYLPKEQWNRIIGSGPMYIRDYKAREEINSPDINGNEITLTKFGKEKFKGRRVA